MWSSIRSIFWTINNCFSKLLGIIHFIFQCFVFRTEQEEYKKLEINQYTITLRIETVIIYEEYKKLDINQYIITFRIETVIISKVCTALFKLTCMHEC